MATEALANKKRQSKNGAKTTSNDLTSYKTSHNWPNNIEKAYERDPGPYTVQNSCTILSEETLELFNGWLVWQIMTDVEERGIAAAIQEILSFAARLVGFGQAYPDQFECVMNNGDMHKPDVCLLSKARYESQVELIKAEGGHLVLKGSPELVVEIRSPSNRRTKERLKRQHYFESGALIVWDVDYRRQKIWVYELENPEKGQEYSGEAEISCERLLPGWRRKVSDFFKKDLSAEEIAGQAANQWRDEGSTKALREVLLRQLRRRFGNELRLAELEARLKHYNEAQLTDLIDNVVSAASYEEWSKSLPK